MAMAKTQDKEAAKAAKKEQRAAKRAKGKATRSQLKQAFDIQRKRDKALIPIMLACVLGGGLLFFLLGLWWGAKWFWLIMGLILGVTQLVGAVGAGSLVLTVNDAAAFPEPTELAKTFGAVILAIVLWSLIGLGLGSVVSSPIVTVLIGVVGALVADVGLQIIAGFVDWIADVAPYLPGPATGALMGTDDQFLFWDALSQGQGGLVLLAYALVLTLVGIFIYRRKDVG